MIFSEAIEQLIDLYKSIDIRVVAYYHENIWKAAYLIVRFRKETVNEVKQEQDDILNKTERITADGFCVRLFALPINQWEKIENDWANNFICLEPNFAVNFSSNDDMNAIVSSPHNYYQEHLFLEWDSYYVRRHTFQDFNIVDKIRNFDVEARRNFFKSIQEYLSVVLQIEENELQQRNGLKIILAPIYFKINEIIFDDESINFQCKGHPFGKIITIVDFLNIRRGSSRYTWKDRIKITHDTTKEDKFEYKISHKIKKPSIDEGFKLSIHRENGLLIYEKSSNDIKSYWPTKSEITNPIFPIFKEFVDSNNFFKILSRGENKKGKHDSVNFEKGISWLLGLLGLNAIWLGDDYQYSGYGPDKIAIDILGSYNTNTIILANATLGVPEASTFAREKRYRENILQKIVNSEIKVTSILFTNASVETLQENARENGITLIGKNELTQIIEYLDNGDIDEARRMILGDLDPFTL